jgi:hypothetical protein
MPRLRRPLICLAAVGAAALIAGCGGGSDAPSVDEFREQADAVCADANQRLDALTEPASGAEVLPFLQAGLPIQAQQLERIRELTPPDELQASFDEATDLLQQRQDLIQDAADRIAAGEDPEAVIAEIDPEVTRLQAEARAKARALGLTVCGAEDDGDGTATSGTGGTVALPPPDTPTGTTAAPGGGTDAYVADVAAAVAGLRGFSELLQGTTSLEDLRARVPGAQAELQSFDDAVAKLDGYSFDNATLEAQRAQLAETGPAVADQLRRFLSAAESGDAETITAVLPGVTQALNDFQEAATP